MQIVAGVISCQKVHESQDFLAFLDISPMAQVHALVIPKKHYRDLDATISEAPELASRLLVEAHLVAKKLPLHANSYRVGINVGAGAGQTVFHLHAHLLSDPAMGGNIAGK